MLSICDVYENHARDYVNKYSPYLRVPSPPASDDVQHLKQHLANLEKKYLELQSLVVEPLTFNYKDEIEPRYRAEIDAYERQVALIKEQYEERMSVERSNMDQEANKSLQPILRKYDELMEYKDAFSSYLLKYNIHPSDMTLDDVRNQDELLNLLNFALEGCKDLSKGSKALRLVLPKEASPVQVLLTCLGVAIAAPVLPLLYFGYLYYDTFKVYHNIDRLRLMQALIYNFDPKSLKCSVEYDPTELMKELSEKLASIHDPTEDYKKAMADCRSQVLDINDKCVATTNEIKASLEIIKSSYPQYIAAAKQRLEEAKSKIKRFGEYINTSAALTSEFILDVDESEVPVPTRIGLTNILLDSDAIDFAKVILSNFLLGVKEKHLVIRIYDPDRSGVQFSEFLGEMAIRDYIDIYNDQLSKLIELERTYIQENMRMMNKEDITEFNKNSEAVGKVTRDYHLNVIVSGTEKLKEDTAFNELLKVSAQYGVIFLILCDDDLNGCKILMSEEHNLKWDVSLGASVMSTYLHAYENSKIDAIPYFSGFADKYIPEDKYWTFSTNKGIGLNFGLESGDPTKGYEIFLGDNNVHALMVGTTGSGKSVAINQMVASLVLKYSPAELQMVMVDFKNVEFAMYANTETGLAKLPHCKILAGTKDGAYAVSVFDYLCEEMDRRTAIFSKAGVKKLEEYNNLHPENILPRILVIIDEFQVMFTEVESKKVEIIKQRITSLSKLARFCGCHMWFTSQSMKGTLSQDIMDQFSLRVALMCSGDVSASIIGSKIASTIKTKGYLYTNQTGGNDPKASKMWRIPYASNSELEHVMDVVNKMDTSGAERAYFYDENRMHQVSDLFTHYEKITEFASDPTLFVLGEHTNFTLNKAPENFRFIRDSRENLLIAGVERADQLNLIMTFINQFKLKGVDFLFHTADRDIHVMTDPESFLRPEFVGISDPNTPVADWIQNLEGILEDRKQRPLSELKPLYLVFALWEKDPNFGSASRLADKAEAIFRECGSYDIHIIMVVKNTRDMSSQIQRAFNHKIVSKTSSDESYRLIDSKEAEALPQTLGFALYAYTSRISKFKIYQHTFTKQLIARELVL